jgi:hypothetical protein
MTRNVFILIGMVVFYRVICLPLLAYVKPKNE